MNKISLLLLVIICGSIARGQVLTISNVRENSTFLGIDNPIEIVVENTSCGSFFTTTDNGKIMGDSCFYNFLPQRIGKAIISVKTINDKDTVTLGESEFRVVQIPEPTARVAHKISGDISANELAYQGGIIVTQENIDISVNYFVIGFSVIIITSVGDCYYKIVPGSRFTDEIKAKFSTLDANDTVYFVDINAKGPDNVVHETNDVHLKIK